MTVSERIEFPDDETFNKMTPLELLQLRQLFVKAQVSDIDPDGPMFRYEAEITRINVRLVSLNRCPVCGRMGIVDHECYITTNYGHRFR